LIKVKGPGVARRSVKRVKAARRHPLQRILEVKDEEGGVRVTTTGRHLGRRIGEALGKSFKGDAGR
jgi:uncharacterized protein (UPF0210 family)